MKRTEKSFVVCINNKGYPASLEIRKLYQSIPDETAAKVRQVRVIDESGEDYLYPESYFAAVRLPQAAERALLRAR
jgi:hypothetical protein